MSDPRPQEGWAAPLRLPLIAAAATLGTLLLALAIGGSLYRSHLRPQTKPPAVSFPAPRLETLQTPPRERRPDYRQPAPPRIGAAMAATAREGDALWGKPGR